MLFVKLEAMVFKFLPFKECFRAFFGVVYVNRKFNFECTPN